MPITRTPMVDDDGSGTTGTIINNAWKQELYGQIDGTLPGWTAVPFDVANFWTGVTAGMVLANNYTTINKTFLWMVDTSGMPAPTPPSPYAYFRLPIGSIGQSGCFSAVAYCADGGTAIAGTFLVFGSANHLVTLKLNGANWTGPMSLRFTAIANLI
jgi:hypothetical protein